MPEIPSPPVASGPTGRRRWLGWLPRNPRSSSSTASARPRGYGGTWQAPLRADIARIESSLPDDARRRALRRPAGQPPEDVIGRIVESLDNASALLDNHQNRKWPMRVGRSGPVFEAALAQVYRASEDLFLVADEAAVIAQLPGLRAAVRTYLGGDDPRTDTYVEYCDQLMKRMKTRPPPADDPRAGRPAATAAAVAPVPAPSPSEVPAHDD